MGAGQDGGPAARHQFAERLGHRTSSPCLALIRPSGGLSAMTLIIVTALRNLAKVSLEQNTALEPTKPDVAAKLPQVFGAGLHLGPFANSAIIR